MSGRRNILIANVTKPVVWRNFAENPMEWTELMPAFLSLQGQAFVFEIDFVDFGAASQYKILRGPVRVDTYPLNYANYSIYAGFVPFASSVTSVADTSIGLRFLNSYGLMYKNIYPQGSRVNLSVAVDPAAGTVTLTANGNSLSTAIVLLDSWENDGAALSNFNGYIYKARLLDGDGNVVWEAPMSDLTI